MWYNYIIEDGRTLTVGSTDKIDLPEQGDLSALMIKFSGSPTSNLGRTGLSKARLRDYIDDIVFKANATREYCHVDAVSLAAFHHFDLGIMPFNKQLNFGTGGVDDWFILNFGRYLQDEQYGIELDKCENPQLWLTNSAASGQFTGIGLDLVAIMRWKGGPGFPGGYLHKKEYKAWTTVKAVVENTKLPTSNPCRRILIRTDVDEDTSFIQRTNMFNPMQKIKLTFKSGQEIFWDGASDILARMMTFQHGHLVNTSLAAGYNADIGFKVGIGYVNARAGVPGDTEGAAASTYTTLQGGRTDTTQKLEGGGDDDMPEFMFRGICPENTLGFLFDSDPNPRTWLDLGLEKQVELKVTTRDHDDADDATNYVLLERLLPQGIGA